MKNPYEHWDKNNWTQYKCIGQFELYSAPLKCTDPKYLKGIFLNVLKEENKEELNLHPVESPNDLTSVAELISGGKKPWSRRRKWKNMTIRANKSYPINKLSLAKEVVEILYKKLQQVRRWQAM